MSIRAECRDLLSRFPLADGLFRRFVWSRIHFPEVEMRFLDSLSGDSIDIAVDVGAAMGSYSWILNRKSKQIFSFEPGERYGRNLERCVFGSRIRVVKAAVGSVYGVVNMYTPGSDTNALHSATLSKSNPVSSRAEADIRQVEQVTLDGFFTNRIHSDQCVDIIKVDVEGYELEVFKGAESLISLHHPLIFCEIEERHNVEYEKIFQLLRSAGYRSYVFKDGKFQPFDGNAIGHFQSADALKSRLDGSYDPAKNLYINNFVFQHPKSRIKVLK